MAEAHSAVAFSFSDIYLYCRKTINAHYFAHSARKIFSGGRTIRVKIPVLWPRSRGTELDGPEDGDFKPDYLASEKYFLQITSEGLTYNYNTKVLGALTKSTIQSWKHSASRLKNSFYSKFYPFHVTSWFIFAVAVFIASYFDVHASRYPVSLIENFLKTRCGLTLSYHIFACLIFAFLLWSLVSSVNKLLLRVLLSRTGWIYKMPKNIDASVKIWAYSLKLLQGRKPRLYSYQGSLPSLPLPSLSETLERYLTSVRCLHTEKDFAEVCRKAKEFRQGSGKRLQFFLTLKYWLTSNYVTDWWEEYVYLSNRAPLMSNSNYYGLDTMCEVVGNPTQAARAALICYHCLQIRHAIYLGEMEPIMLHGIVPLCSLQYERQFNTTRIPQTGEDVIKHWTTSDHFAVYHRGRYFKCPFTVEGRYLLPVELEAMFESILGDVSEPAPGEELLGALTAGPRDDWATARKSFFSSGVNRISLNAIEKAAFFVTLDEEAFGNDYNNLSALAKSALCGKCYDRWFDKSFTLIIYKDGKFAANSEHSWADAPVTSHAVESCLVHEYHNNVTKKPHLHYVNGHCDGEPKKVLAPIRLHWKLPEQCISVIESSYSIARELADSVDLVVRRFEDFGKRLPKKCGLSPDSFLQMAFQLAYYMERKHFCLTYESSMVRMFREGRTDTVRSCCPASCEFVQGFLDPNLSVETKRELLKTACDQHQRLYRDAMVGKAVDRHLFALYVVSKFLKSDSPFLKEILSEPWRLSTSQTPIRQCNSCFYPSDYLGVTATPGGGFGPVTADGYGVSYIFAGEDHIFLHISSYRTSKETDSEVFMNRIFSVLRLLRDLHESASKSQVATETSSGI